MSTSEELEIRNVKIIVAGLIFLLIAALFPITETELIKSVSWKVTSNIEKHEINHYRGRDHAPSGAFNIKRHSELHTTTEIDPSNGKLRTVNRWEDEYDYDIWEWNHEKYIYSTGNHKQKIYKPKIDLDTNQRIRRTDTTYYCTYSNETREFDDEREITESEYHEYNPGTKIKVKTGMLFKFKYSRKVIYQ